MGIALGESVYPLPSSVPVNLHPVPLPLSSRGTDIVGMPSDRDPTHPGEMLLQEFVFPLGMTQRDLATAIHVPFQRVNEVVRGDEASRQARRSGSPSSLRRP